MPTQSSRLHELREAADPGDVPYISKSRIKQFKTCPRKFFYQYLRGVPTKETEAMRRGTAIHETIEDYYLNAMEYYAEHGDLPANPQGNTDLVSLLPDDTERWSPYLDPYFTNFIKWEYERLKVSPSIREWLPVEVEGEEWLDDPLNYGEGAIPWMGYADVILRSTTVPGVADGDGVVVVDFKSSDSTPDEKYRDEGIYLEGEYYAMLFESEYDVDAVGGMYPAPGELITAPLKEERREAIKDVVRHIQEFRDMEDYEAEEQPLCQWDADNGCDFYGLCSSTWAEPVRGDEEVAKLKSMVKDGKGKRAIVDEFGCTFNAAGYWQYKVNSGQV